MAAGECEQEYLMLKDVRIDLNRDGVFGEEGFAGFSLCLWIYLSSSAWPSSVILGQVSSEIEGEVPFLALNEQNKLILFPLMFLHSEASFAGSTFPWSDIHHITSESECPLERWVHVGCKATADYICLYLNGELSDNMPLSSSSDDHNLDNFKKVALAGSSGNDGKLQGYVYNASMLSLSASIKDDFAKNPPVKLSLNGSCTSDALEVGNDGVWSIVGGKASCRRNFSLDVVLSDAVGQFVHKDMEITASLVYADNGAPVEKTQDNSFAPLLVGFEGLEYPSTERPIAVYLGHATFKLKLSQLSSKSDNRLFSICFRASQTKCYPFFETRSPPIRCISRSRCIRPVVIGKRQASASPICDRTQLPGINDRFQETHEKIGIGHAEIVSHRKQANGLSSKRPKISPDKSSKQVDANANIAQEEKAFKMNSEARSNNLDGSDNCPSDSESIDARNSEVKCIGESIDPMSDMVIFRYCLEGTYERSLLLKEIIKSSSNEELVTFADQVCLYSGCLHHRYPILISKKLVQEGNDTWNSICQNGNRALWITATVELNKRFMSISRSTTHGLSEKDLEVLRGIAGCGEELGLENFNAMWQWLYPVAVALSDVQINGMWECTSPKWIEGFITVEEAEKSLKCPRGIQKPGTFVLRFPTSRSWPHPDAGSLVVTYIGADLTIHHKLISIDHSKESGAESLQNLLLKEPELSQLGRVVR
ncbi:SH2 domain-containing protein A isoform X1 [Dendrobium catenatum]|nr:SH2 domain-containing protein A isoform X1 [Dendrobium catenatum]